MTPIRDIYHFTSHAGRAHAWAVLCKSTDTIVAVFRSRETAVDFLDEFGHSQLVLVGLRRRYPNGS